MQPNTNRSGGRHTAAPGKKQVSSGSGFAQQHPRLFFLLQHLWWGLRLALAVVAISPVFFFMVWFNYTVDCSGLFHGDVYTREIAAMLLAGENVDEYSTMDERSLTKLLVEQMETVPQVVALGSSRVMQMTHTVAGTESFFNFGMTGGDFFDVLGTWYLFEEKGQLPTDVILCIDPWLFNGSGAGDTERSDKNLYAQMLSACLGESMEFTTEDPTALWKALISPSYFQGNWKYYRHERKLQAMPQAVSGEAYDNSTTEIKNSDGSVHYPLSMRTQTAEQTEWYALEMAGTFAWCDSYDRPDAERLRLFRTFVEYLQAKDIRVYFLLTPLHPLMYEYALTYPADHMGFLRSELAVLELGEALEVPVYGSYNPHILEGLDAGADFYDGVHITSECLQKFWPGIETVRRELAEGILPTDRRLNTLDNDLYAELQLRCGPAAAEQLREELALNITDAD